MSTTEEPCGAPIPWAKHPHEHCTKPPHPVTTRHANSYFTWQTVMPETGEVAPRTECEAHAYRVAARRLRLLHTELSGRRQDWAANDVQPCSSARAVAYQSAMSSVGSIIDEIEAIAAGVR